MDRFTRNYTIGLLLVVGLALAWALYENPEVSRLNRLLSEDPIVSTYPYPFRVFRLEVDTAILGSPRSVEFPAYRALGILFPRLAGLSPDHPDMVKAQKTLAQVQRRAREIVMKSPRVKEVRWELDENWLVRHGAQLSTRQ